jgi:hypothetical protein
MVFACESYPFSITASVFHNVQTIDFHGILSDIDTFSQPQSREIDVLLETHEPKKCRLLISCKDYATQVEVKEIGDLKELMTSLRTSPNEWLYWSLAVGRHGFQAGCEAMAKTADIALVPPVTGNVAWLKYLTLEEIVERVEDAIKVFLLGDISWLDASSYTEGNLYNGIIIATREPSGMPGQTKIRNGESKETTMKAFIDEALKRKGNKFEVPLSRGRTYIPLFDPPQIQSLNKQGQVVSSVDQLKPGTKILGVSEDNTRGEVDEVLDVNQLRAD